MNKINLLMVIALWITGHMLVYAAHTLLVGIYDHYVHLMLALFLVAVFTHYRLATHMISKVSTYL
jgi:hypothetical protein